MSYLNNAQYVTLTTDGWTSLSNESFISVTVHFITKQWELMSCILTCVDYSESHTSQNMYDLLRNVCTEWGIIEKVHFVVTDNASNMKAAIKLTNWFHIPCLAHTLNLIVQKGLHEIEEIRGKVKKNVGYFHKSSQANEKLKSTQNGLNATSTPLKLKNDVSTRWNLTFFMFERILQLEEPLTVTIGLLHNPVDTLSEDEWKILKEICKILQPFEQITTEMSAEKTVTLSKVIVLIRGLGSALNKFEKEMSTSSNITKKLIAQLKAQYNERFDNLENNSTLGRASLLDPRFKEKSFSDEKAYIKSKDRLQGEMVALINEERQKNTNDEVAMVESNEEKAESETNMIWQEFDEAVRCQVTTLSPTATAIAEFRLYLEEPYIFRKDNPLEWWKKREMLYPTLAKLARKYLSIVATSVPSERVFSKAGQVITERRNRLKPKYVNKILFLHFNEDLLNTKK